jgi:alpha-glucosidase (family GH31 glycosyl hydrolase)
MTVHRSIWIILSLLLALLPGFAHAAPMPPNPVAVGQARFTVISPFCIRLEYNAEGRFVDQPSLFAVGRTARFDGFRLTQSGDQTVIDTGIIRLIYASNGQPFSPSNLQAVIHRGGIMAHWTPGAPNLGNLGGTLRTLDGAVGPEDLGQGLISRDGWYLLDDSRTPLLTKDWVESRPTSDGTDWYLFGYGDDYRAALRTLAVIGGPVPMPRKYALGSWYSRYWPYSSADYREIVSEYAAHDFPLDNIVLDMDWHKDGWTGWSWNRKLLPDAEQLLPWFHRQDLHDTLNLHPADGVGPQEDQYGAFMRDMGANPSSGQTIPFDAGSKKYMDTLFKDVLDPLRNDGVDFWWLDWQQDPYTRSILDLTNLFWLNTLLFDYTGEGGQRGMSFSRWGGWGDHRHPIHFSGDADTGFPMLAFEVPFTSTAGNVGCFFWSHDIGGHHNGRNEESYTRWVQFGSTSPVLRLHSARDPTMDRRPWLYPAWATNSMRISFHLRDRLFPYLYSSAWETTQEMVPLDRPMYIAYPDAEPAYHQAQQYFFGDDLLAAPIVTPGVGPGRVAHQTVWFPPSDWYNVFTGEEYRGDGHTQALVSADITEFPLYARGGVPIPMQPYTSRMATAPLTTLVVRCYPGQDGQEGTFPLHEDDGQTTAYQHGASATTLLSYVRHGNTVTVTVGAAVGHYRGQVRRRGLIVELATTARATGATVNGNPAAMTYDAADFLNRITIPAQPVSRKTVVMVQVTPAPQGQIRQVAFRRRVQGILGASAGQFDGASIKAELVASLRQTKKPALRNELLAAAGIGLVQHSMAPYLYGDITVDEFFAPANFVDGNTVARSSGTNTSVIPNAALDVSGPAILRRGHLIVPPAQVTFAVGGQKIRQPDVLLPINDLLGPSNVAATATVTASGSEGGYTAEGSVDGIVGGYPGDKSQEWSAGATIGAWLRLDWNTPQTVDRIVLYDRPNTVDQVTAGKMTFSDGTVLPVGTLPDDAATGLTLTFPTKTITWVKFTVTGVKPGTQNAGLAEIGVFRSMP